MEIELTPLESKIAQVVALCQSLRAENAALRHALAEVTGERDRLAGKLDAARARLEAVLHHLPDQ